jgi:hypothetical protein
MKVPAEKTVQDADRAPAVYRKELEVKTQSNTKGNVLMDIATVESNSKK